MKSTPDFLALAHQFDTPDIKAIALMGSHARGDAGPFSDVDLVRFTGKTRDLDPADGSYLIDGHLVVVSQVTSEQVETWFSQPEEAVNVITGLRVARSLIDRQDTFATIQARARAFVWDEAMQEKANAWASQEMVGWIEEVHKGLAGLQRDDIGRMLNARFGFSWGLSRVMCVYHGLLLSGDNALYHELMDVMGPDSEWVRLQRDAFGIRTEAERGLSLRAQIRAGLQLYVVTARLLAGALQATDRPLIMQTVKLIEDLARI